MREAQTTWLGEQLSSASKCNGLHKMVLMHNDLRGGSKGKFLGNTPLTERIATKTRAMQRWIT